jgi:hypothetical protein
MPQKTRSNATCALLGAVLLACDRTDQAAPPSPAPFGSDTRASATTGTLLLPLDLTPPAPQAPALALSAAPFALGERAEARDYFLTLVRVTPCAVEPHFSPAAGRVKLGLDVLIEAKNAREVPSNPFLARLRDAQTRDYGADLAGCTPTLRADRLSGSERASGFITFELPEDATGLVMTYSPFVVGVGLEELSFALGR